MRQSESNYELHITHTRAKLSGYNVFHILTDIIMQMDVLFYY